MAAGEEKLRLVLAAIDKTAAPIREVNRRIESMLAPVRKVKNAFRALADEAGLSKLGARLRSVGTVIRNLAVGAVGAGAGILEFARRTADSVDSFSEMTRQLGVGVEQYQDLEFAAMRADVHTEAFAGSMRFLAKNIGALKLGTGPLVKHLGPALIQQLKAANGTGDALLVMLSALRKVRDPLERNAIAAKVFGRSGQSMALMAELSSEKLAELVKESQSFGRISSENAADAAALMDSLDGLKVAATRLATTIVSELFPDMKAATDQVVEFIKAHRVEIVERASAAIRTFAQGVKDAGAFMSDNLPKLQATVDAIGGLNGALKITAAIALAPVVRVFIALGLAIGAVGSAVLGTGAAIAYLLVQLEKLTGIKGAILDVIDPLAPSSLLRRGISWLGEGQGNPRSPSFGVIHVPNTATAEAGAAVRDSKINWQGSLGITFDQRGRPRIGSVTSSSPAMDVDIMPRGLALSPG